MNKNVDLEDFPLVPLYKMRFLQNLNNEEELYKFLFEVLNNDLIRKLNFYNKYVAK